ncbi:2-amino-4-hydroxy-6-hydroxymethyldihydropteridinepyrophosphokinase [Hyella patelloides LEGE 07179]|uniref:2-amino-4-hydroxy-6-hydroxymethyldihydropteridine diphosphokinase n=1 Tax=Hyella patelloides LEGE 07179 TaxID=945734 RepID=A0A563VJI9_9CYAN|nr:2-amino-4-hydroxy-6-hydroxymethyldihydropteridine diphosphokinase [Hyella patelloides]VEP11598.1 2-amino-4-hydroxy-6-hydroxymethyldihydropteridinepyrophosphokinase [Hyella patelloides LEGE 07179]
MNQCAIAFGSNLGDSLKTLESSLTVLNSTPGINLLAVSSWYQTKPIGPPQPDYLNGCATFNVQQTPEELLTLLQAIELQFGRVRNEKWGARTLDLDLILYDDLILNTNNLIIPHPRMRERAFVLVPLAEIAADWQEPVSGKAIAQLVSEIDRSGVTLYA